MYIFSCEGDYINYVITSFNVCGPLKLAWRQGELFYIQHRATRRLFNKCDVKTPMRVWVSVWM